MKLLLAMVFAIVSLLNTPTLCAHAAGVRAVKTDQQQSSGAAHHQTERDHKGHGHARGHGADEHNAHAHHHTDGAHMRDDTSTTPQDHARHQQHGCEDDCDGGMNCENCTAVATAILGDITASAQIAPFAQLSMRDDLTSRKAPAIDPPPPKRACA